MAQLQIDALMEAFTAFQSAEGVDAEEAVRLFLAELFGPTKRVRVGEDDEGQLRVMVDEADPPADVDMDEDVEARLRELGIDTALVRIAARAGSVDEYRAMKAKLEGRRK